MFGKVSAAIVRVIKRRFVIECEALKYRKFYLFSYIYLLLKSIETVNKAPNQNYNCIEVADVEQHHLYPFKPSWKGFCSTDEQKSIFGQVPSLKFALI